MPTLPARASATLLMPAFCSSLAARLLAPRDVPLRAIYDARYKMRSTTKAERGTRTQRRNGSRGEHAVMLLLFRAAREGARTRSARSKTT